MPSPTERIDRLARAIEFDDAHAKVDLLIRWARAVGRMDAAGEQRARYDVASFVDRGTFIAGRWKPSPSLDPWHGEIDPDLLECASRWEAEHA